MAGPIFRTASREVSICGQIGQHPDLDLRLARHLRDSGQSASVIPADATNRQSAACSRTTPSSSSDSAQDGQSVGRPGRAGVPHVPEREEPRALDLKDLHEPASLGRGANDHGPQG